MLIIKDILPIENYKLKVVFETNEKKIVDLSSIIDKGIFRELKEPSYFRQVVNQKYFIE